MHVNSTKIFLTIIKIIRRSRLRLSFYLEGGGKKRLSGVNSYPIERILEKVGIKIAFFAATHLPRRAFSL